jgi:hypothetical protein
MLTQEEIFGPVDYTPYVIYFDFLKNINIHDLRKKIGIVPAFLLIEIDNLINKKDDCVFERDEKLWVSKTLDELSQDLIYGKSSLMRAFKILKNFNIVCVKKRRISSQDQTNAYSINYDILSEFLK